MATNDTTLSYQEAQGIFVQWDSLHDASTWHGWLSGFLAVRKGRQAPKEISPWYEQAMLWLDITGVEPTSLEIDFLSSFFHQTERMINDDEGEFRVILPHSKTSLAQRVSAVAFWAESFLLGFASYNPAQAGLTKDAQDALRGIAEISQITVGEDDEKELEESFTEVVSHLNVLVRVICIADLTPDDTLH
ncbi:MAG: UPF0149 family protein [Pseudomonadota bacterium]